MKVQCLAAGRVHLNARACGLETAGRMAAQSMVARSLAVRWERCGERGQVQHPVLTSRMLQVGLRHAPDLAEIEFEFCHQLFDHDFTVVFLWKSHLSDILRPSLGLEPSVFQRQAFEGKISLDNLLFLKSLALRFSELTIQQWSCSRRGS